MCKQTLENTLSINVTLDPDFIRIYNIMQWTYGPELARLNGFAPGQLNYTEFIDNFIDEETVSDSSIDGSANKIKKDVVTLENEMAKPHEKVLAFNKIYYEHKKLYGKETADRWFVHEYVGKQYMHDANTSSFKSYCFAYDLKRLAEEGLFFIYPDNINPPKHLMTFIDFVKEYINFTSNRTSGAVGLPNLIAYMYYFWREDVKNGCYYGTPEKFAKQHIQRFIYAVNQPYTRDGIQSSFSNSSVFDMPYLEALFGGSTFPDGSYMIDDLDGIMQFQKWYMEERSDIIAVMMYTFPVNSVSILKKKCDRETAIAALGEELVNYLYDPEEDTYWIPEDLEFAKWAIAHNMRWNDSNIFCDDSITSLSNCCFDGSQMTLTRSSKGINFMSFEDLYDSSYADTKKNFTIYHNGSWVKGKIIRLPARKMYKVTTTNNKTMILTDNHINPTLYGEVQTKNLTTDDYLMFNTNPLSAIKERNEKLTYAEGFLVGMYLGDGSSSKHENSTQIDLSINEKKYEVAKEYLETALDDLGETEYEFMLSKPYNNVYPIRTASKLVYDFVKRFVKGKYAYDKELNLECLEQSKKFRQGILDGYYLTDGGNSNRIYTTSEKLVDEIEVLLTSLGLQSIINISDRTDEPVIIRDVKYNRNYPLYCIRWYDTNNRRKLKDVYKVKNNSVYFKIKSIKKYLHDEEYVYCFQMDDEEEPYFTLPNGIITHNCRLKSDISEMYFNSIGGTALKVGSVKVNTINLARIAYEADGDEDKYIEILKDELDIAMKALHIIRHIITRNVEKGLLNNFGDGLIEFEYLYNTVGFIGIYETMKYFGYTHIDEFGNTYYDEAADKFGKTIFDTIHNARKEFGKDKDYTINTEQIPGESAAAKLMKKDMIFFGDKVITDLPLYGNQFIPLGIKTTIEERVRVASLFDSYCNGGSILHVNIEAPFTSFDQAWYMFLYITKCGVTYYAFNTKIKTCRHGHAFYDNKCPICGEAYTDEWTRIVGFFTKVSSYSAPRKAEYHMRKFDTRDELLYGAKELLN